MQMPTGIIPTLVPAIKMVFVGPFIHSSELLQDYCVKHPRSGCPRSCIAASQSQHFDSGTELNLLNTTGIEAIC